MKSRAVILVCVLAATVIVASEYGTKQKYDMTSSDDVTALDLNHEEQELDRLLSELVVKKKENKLQCYTCASTESWEDCERKQTLVGCPDDTTHCIKATITLKKHQNLAVTEYFKSCVSREKCHTQHFPACKLGSKESAQCSVECCDKTYCNKEQNQVDKRSFSFDCKPPCLIYATRQEINGIELMTSRKVPGLTSLSQVTPIDVDMATNTLYWSDRGDRVIKRTNLVSGDSKVVIGGEKGVYDGIAVEWASRLLYWTDRTHKRIEAARLDGSFRRILVDKDLDRPRAIVVDPELGVMFWTDWGETKPRIERSLLSGSNRQVLVSSNIRYPNGLVLDYVAKKVYYSESDTHRIDCMNYDGSQRRVLYSDSTTLPFDLALYKNTLFWSDWSSSSVEKLDVKTGQKLGNFGILTHDRVAGVVVLDPSRKPRVNSRCAIKNGGCSHLCFTTGIKTRVCGCPNGVKLLADQITCDLNLPKPSSKATTTMAETTSIPSTTEQPSETTTQATSTERPTTTLPLNTLAPTTVPSTTLASTTRPSTTLAPTTIPSTTLAPTTIPSTTLAPTTIPSTSTESTTTSPGLKVRLAGGAESSEGRVEVRYNGQWGTICDDFWDLRDAMVVCHMLGYPGAIAEFKHGFFGRGTGQIWLDDVNCMGEELSIDECRHPGWGVHNCMHAEDAGVKCRTDTPAVPIRLVNGRSPNEGRVEVRHNGQWGTVCDDLWSKEDADVICRMLGYPDAAVATIGESFGRGAGPIWLDNVRCRGHELSIEECGHQGWGRSNCEHSEDAGVICKPNVMPTTTLPITTVPTTANPGPLQGIAIICFPRTMYIRISKQHLQRLTSYHIDPDLIHLNDPTCGVTKVTNRYIILRTPLTACGTERRRFDDSLTFTNKVVVGDSSSLTKRASSQLLEIPFRCSYMKTNRRRMLAPPTLAYGRIGQW